MFRIAAIAAAMALAASPAHAGWKVQRAQAIAAAIWHHPCEDHVTLAWGDTVNDGAAAEAFVDQCRIVYSRQPTTWVEFCTTTIHEYGHLAGYRDWTNTADPLHSSNPNSVMAQNTTELQTLALRPHHKPLHVYVGLDRRCADRGRTYLGMRPDSLAKRERFLSVNAHTKTVPAP